MGLTDRNKSITPGLLSRFHFAKLDGFNYRSWLCQSDQNRPRSMTRVSTNKGCIEIPIWTIRKPRSEAHPALNPINSAKGLRPKLNSAIEEKSEQCGESSLTYRISSTSYRWTEKYLWVALSSFFFYSSFTRAGSWEVCPTNRYYGLVFNYIKLLNQNHLD